MKQSSFSYSIKIWLGSVLLAPVIYLLCYGCLNPNRAIDLEFGLYPAFILFGGLFSLITWLLFWLIIEIIKQYLTNTVWQKWLVFGAGMVLTVGTFIPCMLLTGGLSFSGLFFYLMLANCLCIGAGRLFFYR